MHEHDNQLTQWPSQSFLSGVKNRVLSFLVRFAPGQATLRVRLHRWRGVQIGTGVHIGADVLLETEFPQLISIGNDVLIGIRTTILAHMHSLPPRKSKTEHEAAFSVRIEDQVNIGAGVIILPNVTIGQGAVVTAGSVVSSSVPPLTMVQGNPARPIARCGIPLTWETPFKEFFRKLKPIKNQGADSNLEQ
jgi:acetyltransferase-like isoleucine patch superfamily enzyme